MPTWNNMASFKVNRELLNVNFEGYKLSEKAPKHIKHELGDGLKRVKLKSDCFSFQHMRQATMKNLLYPDQWNRGNVVYWISNNRKIMTACLQSMDNVSVRSVFQDTRTTRVLETTPTSNPSLVFVSATTALYYDPEVIPSSILLLNTGYRDHSTSKASYLWEEVVACLAPPISFNDFVIESAHMSNGTLYMIITSLQSQSSTPGCTISVLKAMIPVYGGPAEIDCTILWSMISTSTPVYCDITNVDSILIVCESDLHQVNRSHHEIGHDEMGNSNCPMVDSPHHSGLGYGSGDETAHLGYSWTQTDDDVTIVIPDIPADVVKMDVHCVIGTDSLVVGLTDRTTYIRGRLFGMVDPNDSIWTIDRDKHELTVVLEKAYQGNHWSVLLSGDSSSGELPLSGDMLGLTAKEMEQLKHRIDMIHSTNTGEENSSKRVSDGPVDLNSKRPKPIFQNTLEDCDVADDEQQVKCFIINERGQIINKASVGNKQVLFSLPSSRDSPPFLCLKHDIDALIFSLNHQPLQTSSSAIIPSWSHSHTFNALGYVQASKREKKFLTCDSACSYAVLTDCNRHVFVYMQPSDGMKGHRAEQYVHTFTNNEDIVGVYAAGGGVVFVLCETSLNLLLINFK